MTFNQIILFSFLSVVVFIILSGYLLKIYRSHTEKRRTPGARGARKIDIELKGDIFELDKLAIILEDLMRYQVPVKTILDLNIILEEVYTSIVNHQKEDQCDHKVHISLLPETGSITATVKDRNDEFNPMVIPAIDLNAPLEEISFQGLGFHMVRHLADHLGYKRLEGQNILTIKKSYPAS
ncbi:MAG: ATP-binding protein [bacterium]